MNIYDAIDVKGSEKLAIFNEDYDSLLVALKDLKNLGKDIEHIEILLQDFLPLMAIARVDYNDKIVHKIEKLLLETFDSIKEFYTGDQFAEALKLIEKCYVALSEKEYGTAKNYYRRLSTFYSQVDKDFKKLIFRPCLDISKKLERYDSIIDNY